MLPVFTLISVHEKQNTKCLYFKHVHKYPRQRYDICTHVAVKCGLILNVEAAVVEQISAKSRNRWVKQLNELKFFLRVIWQAKTTSSPFPRQDLVVAPMPQLTEQSLHLVQSWRCDRETPEKCLWVQAEFKPVYPIITYI